MFEMIQMRPIARCETVMDVNDEIWKMLQAFDFRLIVAFDSSYRE
jgi:hypothetical protein